MRRSLSRLAAPALALLLARQPLTAEVQVRMTAHAGEVSIASVFKVTVEVRNAPEVPEFPELKGEGFEVARRGPPQSTRLVFNGVEQSFYSFSFILKPTRPGLLQIPPVQVTIGGRTYASPSGVRIQVQPIQPQDHLVLELEGPAKVIYLDQEFTVRLKVHARRLGGENRDFDPFNPRGSWPRLSIPWFESEEGFANEEFEKFANRLIDPRGASGFPVNSYSRREFFDEVPYRFRFPRAEAERKAGDGRTYPYFVYTLEKKFRAQKPGEFLFEPVLAKGQVIAEERGRLVAVEVIAQSEPLRVTVKSAPEENRPPFFTGGVGRFELAADVKPRKVWVGEPLTLTVTVKGAGLLDNVGPPPLAAQEGFEAQFRIHEEPRTGVLDPEKRTKTFTYGIRAKSAQVKAIPPIAFAYFDPKDEKYITVRTEPLPLTVEEGRSEGREFFDLSRPGGQKSEVQALERTLYPIYELPDALLPASPPPLFGPLHAAALGVPPLASLLILGLVSRHRKLRADPAIRRARQARRRAAESLRAASRALLAGGGAEVHAAIARAVATLIGDRLKLPPAGMTAADAASALRQAGAGEELAARARAVFEQADQARYGASGEGREALAASIREAEALLGSLDAALRGKGGSR